MCTITKRAIILSNLFQGKRKYQVVGKIKVFINI